MLDRVNVPTRYLPQAARGGQEAVHVYAKFPAVQLLHELGPVRKRLQRTARAQFGAATALPVLTAGLKRAGLDGGFDIRICEAIRLIVEVIVWGGDGPDR